MKQYIWVKRGNQYHNIVNPAWIRVMYPPPPQPSFDEQIMAWREERLAKMPLLKRWWCRFDYWGADMILGLGMAKGMAAPRQRTGTIYSPGPMSGGAFFWVVVITAIIWTSIIAH